MIFDNQFLSGTLPTVPGIRIRIREKRRANFTILNFYRTYRNYRYHPDDILIY
jgi:hypothetical protein